MSNKEDVPGVIVFPPLIPLVVLVVGILLDWLVPLGFLAAIPLSVRVVAGLAGVAFGLWALISARQRFKSIGTNVNRFNPRWPLRMTEFIPGSAIPCMSAELSRCLASS
jgi:hypothetical protein